MTDVYIGGTKVDIVSDISVRRSVSDLICSASFSTPLDLLSSAQSRASVIINRSGETLFNGLISSYSMSYQGKALQLSLECSDLSYILAHSLLPLTDTEAATLVYGSTPTASMSGRLTFKSTVYAGDAIESLLTGTGIVHKLTGETNSHIGLRSIVIPETCLVFDPGTTRLEAIQKICDELGALFYIKFIGSDSIAVCDIWTNLASTSDFTTSVSVSDSTATVLSFNLNSVPELICTRVTEEIADDDATTKHAESYTGSAPYIDKYIKIDPNSTINISTDAAAKLTQYANCIERSDISIVGTPIHLFNIVNLSGLYTDIGISPAVSSWRVTDSTITISSEGVYTAATLISSSAEIIDGIVAKAAGAYSPESQIQTTTDNAISASSARIATVTALDETNKTVTVQYAGGGETETMMDRSV